MDLINAISYLAFKNDGAKSYKSFSCLGRDRFPDFVLGLEICKSLKNY